MPLSLLIALLVYLLSDTTTPEKQRKAMTTAAAAGLVTYGVSEYTNWGKENLAPLNGANTYPELVQSVKDIGPVGITAGLGAAGILGGVSPWLIGGVALAAVLLLSGGKK